MNNKKSYEERVHRLGRGTTGIIILAMVSVPLLISAVFNISVNVGEVGSGFIKVFMVFGVIGIIEFMSYPAVLGSSGMYLSFISGNISNLKMPSAVSSMKLANVENGTKEGEIVSAIAISVSTVVTTVILFLGMLFLSFLTPILENPVLKPGFSNLLPSIFGALCAPIIAKDPKTSLFPGVLAAVLTLAKGPGWISANQSILMLVFLVVTVLGRYVFYKIDQNKPSAGENISK